MKTAICTISSNNFLPYGLNCLYSVKKFNPSFDLFYLIADEFLENEYTTYSSNINFINLNEIGIGERQLKELEFKYNIVEFNTSVKPAFYLFLFEKGYDKVVYLDPDMECYYSFNELMRMLDENSVVLTPHKLTCSESLLLPDRAFLNNGIYNLGFIALRNDINSVSFLKWWHNKLMNECYVDYKNGLATDQIWVELAPTIFNGFYVSKHFGMNVAFWNFNERKLLYKDNQYYINENQPLIFFHFSSLSVNCKIDLINSLKNENECFSKFYEEHIKNVISYNFDTFSKIKYKYSQYSNGKNILPEERLFFGLSGKINSKYLDPFVVEKESYYSFIHKKGHNIKILDINSKYRILIFIFGIKFLIKMAYKFQKITINNFAKLYS